MTYPLTVHDILAVVGDDVQAYWQTLGNEYDSIHWKLGAAVAELIPELPAGLVYQAIGDTAGIDPQVVRRAYYCYRDVPPALRIKYHNLSFSIFQHSARLPDKVAEILEYAQQHRSSVREIQALFPVVEDEEVERLVHVYQWPRYFYGIVKEASLQGKSEQVKEHLDKIAELLKTPP